MRGLRTAFSAAVLVLASTCLGGCLTQLPGPSTTSAVSPVKTAAAERECLIRAMYFESNRTSQDGLMAVGTVVMNRVKSGRYADTICGVVGEPGQFAANVMTGALSPAELPPVERAADAILAGKRYQPVGDAMYFHNAAIKIPYEVHYLTVAGGNAFYEKVAYHRTAPAAAASTGTPTNPEDEPPAQPAVATTDAMSPPVPATSPTSVTPAATAFSGSPEANGGLVPPIADLAFSPHESVRAKSIGTEPPQ